MFKKNQNSNKFYPMLKFNVYDAKVKYEYIASTLKIQNNWIFQKFTHFFL